MSSSQDLPPSAATRLAARRGDLDYLIAALSDPEARGYVAMHLGKLRARQAVPALIRNLGMKDDMDRNLTIKALGKIGDPSAAPRLLEVAQNDEASGVRTTAIDALATIGSPDGVTMLTQLAIDPTPLLDSCSRYLATPIRQLERRPEQDTRIRKWAAKRLRQLQATEAAPPLTAALASVDWRHRLRLRRTIRSLRD